MTFIQHKKFLLTSKKHYSLCYQKIAYFKVFDQHFNSSNLILNNFQFSIRNFGVLNPVNCKITCLSLNIFKNSNFKTMTLNMIAKKRFLLPFVGLQRVENGFISLLRAPGSMVKRQPSKPRNRFMIINPFKTKYGATKAGPANWSELTSFLPLLRGRNRFNHFFYHGKKVRAPLFSTQENRQTFFFFNGENEEYNENLKIYHFHWKVKNKNSKMLRFQQPFLLYTHKLRIQTLLKACFKTWHLKKQVFSEPILKKQLFSLDLKKSYQQYNSKSNTTIHDHLICLKETNKSILAKRQRFIQNSLKGILLVNFPEKEKNFLIKNLAAENKIALITQSASLLLKDSRNMDDLLGVDDPIQILFDRVKTCLPCICFINNLDSIGKQRYEQEQKSLHSLNNSISLLMDHYLTDPSYLKNPSTFVNNEHRINKQDESRDRHKNLSLSNKAFELDNSAKLESFTNIDQPIAEYQFNGYKNVQSTKQNILKRLIWSSQYQNHQKMYQSRPFLNLFIRLSRPSKNSKFLRTLFINKESTKKWWPEGTSKQQFFQFFTEKLIPYTISFNSLLSKHRCFQARFQNIDGSYSDKKHQRLIYHDYFLKKNPLATLDKKRLNKLEAKNLQPWMLKKKSFHKNVLSSYSLKLDQNSKRQLSEFWFWIPPKKKHILKNRSTFQETTNGRVPVLELFNQWSRKKFTANYHRLPFWLSKMTVFSNAWRLASGPPVLYLKHGRASVLDKTRVLVDMTKAGFQRAKPISFYDHSYPKNQTNVPISLSSTILWPWQSDSKKENGFSQIGWSQTKPVLKKIDQREGTSLKTIIGPSNFKDFQSSSRSTRGVVSVLKNFLTRAHPSKMPNKFSSSREITETIPVSENLTNRFILPTEKKPPEKKPVTLPLVGFKDLGNTFETSHNGEGQLSFDPRFNKSNTSSNLKTSKTSYYSWLFSATDSVRRNSNKNYGSSLDNSSKLSITEADIIKRTALLKFLQILDGFHTTNGIRKSAFFFSLSSGFLKRFNMFERVLALTKKIIPKSLEHRQKMRLKMDDTSTLKIQNLLPSIRLRSKSKQKWCWFGNYNLFKYPFKNTLNQNHTSVFPVSLVGFLFNLGPNQKGLKQSRTFYLSLSNKNSFSTFPQKKFFDYPINPDKTLKKLTGFNKWLPIKAPAFSKFMNPKNKENGSIKKMAAFLFCDYKQKNHFRWRPVKTELFTRYHDTNLLCRPKNYFPSYASQKKIVTLSSLVKVPKWEIYLKNQIAIKSLNLLCVWPSYLEEILGPSNLNDSASYLLPEYFQLLGHSPKLKKQGITLIASTKNLTTLDAALLRPGRFDTIINFPKHQKRTRSFSSMDRWFKVLKHSPSLKAVKTNTFFKHGPNAQGNNFRLSPEYPSINTGTLPLVGLKTQDKPVFLWQSNFKQKEIVNISVWPSSTNILKPDYEIKTPLLFQDLKKKNFRQNLIVREKEETILFILKKYKFSIFNHITWFPSIPLTRLTKNFKKQFYPQITILDAPSQASSIRAFLDVSIFIQYKLWWSFRDLHVNKLIWESTTNRKFSWFRIYEISSLPKIKTSILKSKIFSFLEIFFFLKDLIRTVIGIIQMIFFRFFSRMASGNIFKFLVLLQNKLANTRKLTGKTPIHKAKERHLNDNFINTLGREILISKAVADLTLKEDSLNQNYSTNLSVFASDSKELPTTTGTVLKHSDFNKQVNEIKSKWYLGLPKTLPSLDFFLKQYSLPYKTDINLVIGKDNLLPSSWSIPIIRKDIHPKHETKFLKSDRRLLFCTGDFDYSTRSKKDVNVILEKKLDSQFSIFYQREKKTKPKHSGTSNRVRNDYFPYDQKKSFLSKIKKFSASSYSINTMTGFLEQSSKIWKPFPVELSKNVNVNNFLLMKYHKIYKLKKNNSKCFFNFHPFTKLMLKRWPELKKSNKLKKHLKVSVVNKVFLEGEETNSYVTKKWLAFSRLNMKKNSHHHHLSIDILKYLQSIYAAGASMIINTKRHQSIGLKEMGNQKLISANNSNGSLLLICHLATRRKKPASSVSQIFEFSNSRVFNTIENTAGFFVNKSIDKRCFNDEFSDKSRDHNLYRATLLVPVSVKLMKKEWLKTSPVNRFSSTDQKKGTSESYLFRKTSINSSLNITCLQINATIKPLKKEINGFFFTQNKNTRVLKKLNLVSNKKKEHNFVKTPESFFQSYKMCRLDVSFFLLIFYTMFFEKIINKKTPLNTIRFFMPYKSLLLTHFLLSQNETYGFSCKNFEILVYNKFQNFLVSL